MTRRRQLLHVELGSKRAWPRLYVRLAVELVPREFALGLVVHGTWWSSLQRLACPWLYVSLSFLVLECTVEFSRWRAPARGYE